MGKLVVCTNLTLDGVMQAPGLPDEDPRDGFVPGGWAAPYAATAQAGEAFAAAGALPHLRELRQGVAPADGVVVATSGPAGRSA